jgi:hypothetical protein
MKIEVSSRATCNGYPIQHHEPDQWIELNDLAFANADGSRPTISME